MLFQDVYLVSENLATIMPHELAQIEQNVPFSFPLGYPEYMTTLGVGNYCGYVRIYPPQKIEQEYTAFQHHWETYYVWEHDQKVLTKQQVLESITIADTGNGEALIFHPSTPDRFYVLSPDEETIYFAGGHLKNVLVWMCESDVLTNPLPFRYFESWRDRMRILFDNQGNAPSFLRLRQQILSSFHDAAQYIDDQEGYLKLFVQDFFGTVTVFGFPKGFVRVCIMYDLHKETPLLQTLVQLFHDEGLEGGIPEFIPSPW